MRILLNEEREYKVNDICVILLHVKIKSHWQDCESGSIKTAQA